MERQLQHGTRTWDTGNRMLSSAMTPEEISRRINDFKDKIKQLREVGDADGLRELLEASFGPTHPNLDYAEQLLETRLKVMEEVFLEHFGNLQPVSRVDTDGKSRLCLSILRPRLTFAQEPWAVFAGRRLAA